jgi:pseudouridylate synthase
MQSYKKFLKITDEVAQALEQNRPVVALESTIISHGMPWPENKETALLLEESIRQKGAIPATIAIIDGIIHIGIDEKELDYLATGDDIVKASRRDLPVVLATGKSAATTVAATMIAAELAGIRVFATGGIGGVHRGADKSFDISADLQELAKTDVAVVCAGIKAILDLPLTLEYLETLGVPVLGYRTEELPAFYSRSSGLNLDHRVESAEEAAEIMRAKWECTLQGGVLITNPIPEASSMARDKIDRIIDLALAEAEKLGVRGKDITPFLLDKVKALSGGESLKANIELVKNNALLAAEIACAYSEALG